MADNTIKGFRHKLHAKVPGKTPNVSGKGTVRIKPKRVKGPVNNPNMFKLGGQQKAAADLHKLVATRTDVPKAGGIAGRSLDALKSKLLGQSADPVAALLAKIDGLPDSEAAGILAEALIKSNVGVA